MIITHNVRMDLARRDVDPLISAVQDDKYSRDIAITLTANNVPWAIPEGTTAVIHATKPDGTGCNYTTMPDGSAAYRYQGNTLTVALAPQVLTAPGEVHLSVGMISGQAELHTFRIRIDVQPKPGLQAASSNYFKIAGALADSGWTPNKYLGTDAEGNVVEKDAPAGGAQGDPLAGVAVTEHTDGSVSVVNTLESGATETIVIGADENGDPNSLTYNGVAIPFSFTVETAQAAEETT